MHQADDRNPAKRRRRGRRRRPQHGNQRRGPRQGQGRGPRTWESVPQGEPTESVSGVLQLSEKGHGFLRSSERDYNAEPTDTAVPRELIERFAMENGLAVEGLAVPADRPGQPAVLAEVRSLNGKDPAAWPEHVPFKNLVAESPTDRIRLEVSGDEISTRVLDLMAPIGKGQRCLIVAPPKAGKTVLLQKIAHSISENHPECHLIVLLVDERPEEVTDMRRSINGEVIASSSDELARNHVQIAEIVIDRARRLVESGDDVVLLLDSITRLSRAYNTEQRGSGRVLSGGIDARTMEKPRRFFGAARNVHEGGSLTVIGTALIDTGSRMDEVIFQEFKGTGNMEVTMDRTLFERRIFPAIDIALTGTRKEEKLFTPDEYAKVTLLRRALASLKGAEAMQLLVQRLAKYSTNAEFLADMHN